MHGSGLIEPLHKGAACLLDRDNQGDDEKSGRATQGIVGFPCTHEAPQIWALLWDARRTIPPPGDRSIRRYAERS